MKKDRTGKYKVVDVLPDGAMTVKEYCELMGFSHAYVYKLLKSGKAEFAIVLFHEINWVVLTK